MTRPVALLVATIAMLTPCASSAQVRTSVAMDAALGSGLGKGGAAVCYRNPRGGCLDSYPEFAGPTFVAGLAAALADHRLELRAGGGGGAYAPADGPRVGATVGQVDGAAFPVKHVGLVFGGRWIVIPRYRGDRLSVLPWMLGLRIR
jgi:hypothetical protein